MMPNSPGPLLNHLPAIYHTSEDLRTVLSVFEAVLFGMGEKGRTEERRQRSINENLPLEDAIANIASLFDALETPKEFVPWLAQWVALAHLDGLTEERQRQLLAEIVPLYAKRGTKKYLEELLKFFTPENAAVVSRDQDLPGFIVNCKFSFGSIVCKVEIQDQDLPGLVVGAAWIGLGSRLGPDRPFWFRVKITTPASVEDSEEWRKFKTHWEQAARQVIDLAKPAHTLYELHWQLE